MYLVKMKDKRIKGLALTGRDKSSEQAIEAVRYCVDLRTPLSIYDQDPDNAFFQGPVLEYDHMAQIFLVSPDRSYKVFVQACEAILEEYKLERKTNDISLIESWENNGIPV